MGSVHSFRVDNLRKKYNLEAFFETGTFEGQAVECAYRLGFKEIHSMEIVERLTNKAKEVFKKRIETHAQQISSEDIPEIHIYHGSSKEILSMILPTIKKNILFWLDAHFPGATPGERGPIKCDGEYDDSLKLPLESEIEIISKRIGLFKDVIIIDDLRLYEELPLEDGMWKPKSTVKNINLIDVFNKTHNMMVYSGEQGYLLITPK